MVDALPPKMKSDVKKKLYFIDERDILKIHHERTQRDLIVLPPEHCKAFLHYYHHNMFTGIHASTTPMAKELIKSYYWPGYYADIEHYVSTCYSCQVNEAIRNNKRKDEIIHPKTKSDVGNRSQTINKQHRNDTLLVLLTDLVEKYGLFNNQYRF